MSLADRVKSEGNPLVDGNQATFVFLGEEAPQLIGDFNDWGHDGPPPPQGAQLTESEPGVWTYTLELHDDAYIEYVYTTDLMDKDARVMDPHNPNVIGNGVGQDQNWFTMPAFTETPLATAPEGGLTGTLTEHQLEIPPNSGQMRDVWLYAPPTDDPVPLIVNYDGNDYIDRGKLAIIVDNLIAAGDIQPVALAMIANAGELRFLEYNTNETTLIVITQMLLPLAQKHLNLLDISQHPGAYGIMGASMGGLMSLYTGLRLPQIFGHVLSQSGAYETFGLPLQNLAATLVEHAPKQPIKIWQDAGRYEWLLDSNRKLHDLLVAKGYDVTYHEFSGGHNYTSWRNVLPTALKSLYGKSTGAE